MLMSKLVQGAMRMVRGGGGGGGMFSFTSNQPSWFKWM